MVEQFEPTSNSHSLAQTIYLLPSLHISQLSPDQSSYLSLPPNMPRGGCDSGGWVGHLLIGGLVVFLPLTPLQPIVPHFPWAPCWPRGLEMVVTLDAWQTKNLSKDISWITDYLTGCRMSDWRGSSVIYRMEALQRTVVSIHFEQLMPPTEILWLF